MLLQLPSPRLRVPLSLVTTRPSTLEAALVSQRDVGLQDLDDDLLKSLPRRTARRLAHEGIAAGITRCVLNTTQVGTP